MGSLDVRWKIVSILIAVSVALWSADSEQVDPVRLAKKLHLSPASKAMIQWERIFKSPRKLKR